MEAFCGVKKIMFVRAERFRKVRILSSMGGQDQRVGVIYTAISGRIESSTCKGVREEVPAV